MQFAALTNAGRDHPPPQALTAQIVTHHQGTDLSQILPNRCQGATGHDFAVQGLHHKKIADVPVQINQRARQQQALLGAGQQQAVHGLHIVQMGLAGQVVVFHYFWLKSLSITILSILSSAMPGSESTSVPSLA